MMDYWINVCGGQFDKVERQGQGPFDVNRITKGFWSSLPTGAQKYFDIGNR
jgi:hypothetical protein